MRIVGGNWRGRKLWVPPGNRIRPTTDRVRESAFNILTNRLGSLEDLAVLDLFAGVGALGLEALSRGASSVIFFDNHAESCRAIQRNIQSLGAIAEVVRADATRLHERPARSPQAELVLMDPPYQSGLAPAALQALCKGQWIRCGVLAMIEQMANEDVAPVPGWQVIDDRKYGESRLLFLELDAE